MKDEFGMMNDELLTAFVSSIHRSAFLLPNLED